jgi:hypothetical protein
MLRQFRFEWPAFDLAFWAMAMRFAMVAVAIAGVIWLVRLWKPVSTAGTEGTGTRVQHGATEALSSQKEN